MEDVGLNDAFAIIANDCAVNLGPLKFMQLIEIEGSDS